MADHETIAQLAGLPATELAAELVDTWEQIKEKDAEIESLQQKMQMLREELEEGGSTMDVAAGEILKQENKDLREKLQAAEQFRQRERDYRKQIEEMTDAVEASDKATARVAALEAELIELRANPADSDKLKAANETLAKLKGKLQESLVQLKAAKQDQKESRQQMEQLQVKIAEQDGHAVELTAQLEEMKTAQDKKQLSVEQEYLLQQVDELKERLKQRNLEYEALKTREKAIHKSVFEKDEKISELTAIMTMLEESLQDANKELKGIKGRLEEQSGELEAQEEQKLKDDMIDAIFADNVGLKRKYDRRKRRSGGKIDLDLGDLI